VTLHSPPSANADVVKLRLGCAARSGGCGITAVLTTIETAHGGKPALISAPAKNRQGGVILATKTVRIAAGRTATLTITLNSSGQGLLAKFKRLPVRLTITLIVEAQRSIVATATLTIKAS
jgi:hypothetical protein